MRAQVQTIDAVKATKWLEQMHEKQRPVSDQVVAKYAEDMRTGRWRLTGQPIIFDSEEKLIDGQHRLWAVIQARVEVPMLVVYGVDPDAIHSIDVGRVRPVSTVLGLLGVANPTRVAAIAKQIDYLVRGEDRALSVDQIQQIVEEWPGILWVMTHPYTSHGGLFNTAPILAAFAIAYAKSPKLTADAIVAFRSGADLPRGDPLLTMRNLLAGSAAKLITQGTSGRRSLVRRMLTALYYRQVGKSLSRSLDGTEGVKFYLGNKAKQPKEPGKEAAL